MRQHTRACARLQQLHAAARNTTPGWDRAGIRTRTRTSARERARGREDTPTHTYTHIHSARRKHLLVSPPLPLAAVVPIRVARRLDQPLRILATAPIPSCHGPPHTVARGWNSDRRHPGSLTRAGARRPSRARSLSRAKAHENSIERAPHRARPRQRSSARPQRPLTHHRSTTRTGPEVGCRAARFGGAGAALERARAPNGDRS